jgi:RNA polymerase sigma-70 factor, ECF subfamily
LVTVRPGSIFGGETMDHHSREDGDASPQDGEIMRLLTSHQGMLYAYILSVHPNRVAAQDILQETNMVIWKKREMFEPGTNFKAWSFRIAHFQTLAHLKRVKNRDWMVFSEKLMESMSEEACETLDDFDVRSGALKNCLGKLSETDQDLIRSHYQSGLPLAELGGRLGRTRAAIKQALLRIRRNLKSCIERQLLADGDSASSFNS